MKSLMDWHQNQARPESEETMPEVKLVWNTQIPVRAMLHHLDDLGDATIIGKTQDGKFIARVGEKFYTAIWNIFTGLYYVDTIYGEVAVV